VKIVGFGKKNAASSARVDFAKGRWGLCKFDESFGA
jgi:hypothetical protein